MNEKLPSGIFGLVPTPDSSQPLVPTPSGFLGLVLCYDPNVPHGLSISLNMCL